MAKHFALYGVVLIGFLLVVLGLTMRHLYPLMNRTGRRLRQRFVSAGDGSQSGDVLRSDASRWSNRTTTEAPWTPPPEVWTESPLDSTSAAGANATSSSAEPQLPPPPPPVTPGPTTAPRVFTPDEASAFVADLKRRDPMCTGSDGKWWRRAQLQIGFDFAPASCYQELHRGENVDKNETLLVDPAFRYPCAANFDEPIIGDPPGGHTIFRQLERSWLLPLHSFGDGTVWCNVAYSVDNVFVTFNFEEFPSGVRGAAYEDKREGCCVSIDAAEPGSSLYVPLDSHFHFALYEKDRVGDFTFGNRRLRALALMEPVLITNNKSMERLSPAALEVVRRFWAEVAARRARNESLASSLALEEQILKREAFFLFNDRSEFDAVFGAGRASSDRGDYTASTIDFIPGAIARGSIAHVINIDLTSHPPLGMQMLLSSLAHLVCSGVLHLEHTRITIVVPDPAHQQRNAGHNFEALLRILPVRIVYVQRGGAFPAVRQRSFYAPRMTFAPRGTVDTADECLVSALPTYLVPALVARVRFALMNGRLPPAMAEAATTTLTTATAAADTASATPSTADPSTTPAPGRFSGIDRFSDYKYLYPGEYTRLKRRFLLRKPIPVELERPWWVNERASAYPDAAYLDDLMRNPPPYICLLKSGVDANSNSRGVYPHSDKFDALLRKIGYVVISDVLPIDIRMYLINHARRVITNWGGSATAMQGLFSGTVYPRTTRNDRWNNWTQADARLAAATPDVRKRRRILDVIMFMPPAYSGLLEWLWWSRIPVKRNHDMVPVYDRSKNRTLYVEPLVFRSRVQSNGVTVELGPPGVDGMSEYAFASTFSFTKLVRVNSLDDVREEHLVISDEEKRMDLAGPCRDRVVDPNDTEQKRRRRWLQMPYRFPAEARMAKSRKEEKSSSSSADEV